MGHKKSNLCFILLLHFTSLIHCLAVSLDTILHDHALRVMSQQRQHSDKLYDARLPNYLAGMKVSVVGLRSRTLWRKGANFSSFLIPPKTLPMPYVKRILIVYHNLGNCSSSYYSLSGYTLLTPVVGFLVYDASDSGRKNLSNVELNTNGKTISVSFDSSSGNKGAKCAAFGPLGDVSLSDLSSPNSCYSKSEGHFSIVTPVNERHKTSLFWIFGFVAGFMGLILGTVAVRSLLCMRSQEMEREADEGEFLKTYWIASSKMPRAQVTRTQPVLESKIRQNPKMSWYA
ncbi:hypothetical protein AAHA92_12432 [Salvia divinorum]|uniref:Uncharacterized protein n=1 Tax=Salvia divinorum TaxID=28513 RepID=A0ABD1HNK4_SALDI